MKIVKLVIGYRASRERLSALRAAARAEVRLKIVCTGNMRRLRRELTDADAYVPGWGNDLGFVLANAKKLRWVQLVSAGVDGLLIPELRRKGLVLTKARGIHGIPMAEHAMGALLAVTRNLFLVAENQRRRRWSREQAFELFGKTMVVAGAGDIGSEVAKRAKAFGMKVIGISRSGKRSMNGFFDAVFSGRRLAWAVARADVVLCVLPLTAGTAGTFSAGIFRKMKRGAIFMNLGRGGTVDEKALVSALRSGRLSAAILDVFAKEPLPRSSPLWAMTNVFISPHMSGQSPHTMERAFGLITENLSRFVRGRGLLNAVDLKKGY